jgi:hypothetical protein
MTHLTCDDEGSGVAVQSFGPAVGAAACCFGVDGLVQLLSGQAKDPDIPEIEQSSGPAAAMRPPALVARRTVRTAVDDRASIERIDFLLS